MMRVIGGASVIAFMLCSALGQTTEARLKFEVASVKPGDPRSLQNFNVSGARFVWGNAPLKDIIGFAFHALDWQFSTRDTQGMDDRFSIEAKKPEGSRAVVNIRQDEELREMLRSLLEDRFRLKAHWETKDGPVYELVAAKNGPKLKNAAPGSGDPNEHNGAYTYSNGRLIGTRATMPDLALLLSDILERPVLNNTAIKGAYDFSIEYSRSPDDGRPSVFSSLQEQLGLRLDPEKGPVQTLIIDHLEKPSEN